MRDSARRRWRGPRTGDQRRSDIRLFQHHLLEKRFATLSYLDNLVRKKKNQLGLEGSSVVGLFAQRAGASGLSLGVALMTSGINKVEWVYLYGALYWLLDAKLIILFFRNLKDMVPLPSDLRGSQ
ncbi:hypothetical protein STEG23_015881 [Scotinomys teguina]